MRYSEDKEFLNKSFLSAFDEWEKSLEILPKLKRGNKEFYRNEELKLLDTLEDTLYYQTQDHLLIEKLLISIILMYSKSEEPIIKEKNLVCNEFLPKITELRKKALENQKISLGILRDLIKTFLDKLK